MAKLKEENEAQLKEIEKMKKELLHSVNYLSTSETEKSELKTKLEESLKENDELKTKLWGIKLPKVIEKEVIKEVEVPIIIEKSPK